ncbi:MAG: hypothetical protein ACJ74Y_05640 [Bryobacteraceae bacterium]
MDTYDRAPTAQRTFVKSFARSVSADDAFYALKTDTPQPQSPPVSFNTAARPALRKITISAVKLVLDPKDPIGRFHEFDGVPDIKEMNLIADEIVIRGAWRLPGAAVNIWARKLHFDANARIVTTPMPWVQDARPGAPGADGQAAGDVNLHVGEISADAPGPLFDLTGGVGQRGGDGTAGRAGDDAVGWTAVTLIDYFPLVPGGSGLGTTARRSTTATNLPLSAACVLERGFFDGTKIESSLTANTSRGTTSFKVHNGQNPPELVMQWGDKASAPGNGHAPSSSAGQPGTGGRGGVLTSSVGLPAQSTCLCSGGASAAAKSTPGGAAGRVLCGSVTAAGAQSVEVHVYGTGNIFTGGPTGHVDATPTMLPVPSPGPAQAGLTARQPRGSDASLQVTGVLDWLHPLQVRTVLHFIDDVYLAGAVSLATDYIGRYREALDGAKPSGVDSQTAFDTVRAQLAARAHRIASNLDYFGNPAGWAPRLSLTANLQVYDGEVLPALRALFLAHWIEQARNQTILAAESIEKALDDLAAQRTADMNRWNGLNHTITALQATIANLQSQLTLIQAELSRVENILRLRAQSAVSQRHAINLLLHSASAICSLIPEGQPALGMVGTGLDQIADYDSTKDPDLSKAGSQLADFLAGFATLALKTKAASIALGKRQSAESAPADDTEASQRKKKAQVLSGIAGGLGPFVGKMSKQLAGLKAPKSEIEAELDKLEAADDSFKQVAAMLRQLNKDKERLSHQFTAALQQSVELGGRISSNLLAEGSLYAQRGAEFDQIDHGAYLYVRDLAEAARRSLIRYQYYLVKAYEYELLAPYPSADYRMVEVLNKCQNLLETGFGAKGLLTDTELTGKLKPVLTSTYDGICADLIKHFEDPKGEIGLRGDTKTIWLTITGGAIDALNARGSALLDVMATGNILPSMRNVRIEEVRVTALVFKNAQPIPSDTVTVRVNHSGEGTLRGNGSLYSVRMSGANADSPPGSGSVSMSWGTTYNAGDGSLKPIVPDPDDALLLQQLLKIASSKSAAQLGSCALPAWTNLEMTIEFSGAKIPLDSMQIEMDLSGQLARGEAALIIREAAGRSPELTISANGEPPRKVRALTYEIHPVGAQVRIAASYLGNEPIAGWTDKDVPSTETPGAAITIDLVPDPSHGSGNREITCRFAPGGPVIAPQFAPGSSGWARNMGYFPHTEPNGTVITSSEWVPGFRVRYSIRFVDGKNTETGPGPWSEWMSHSGYVCPILIDFPWDPTGAAVKRRLYRQFRDEHAPVLMVQEIDGNDPAYVLPEITP